VAGLGALDVFFALAGFFAAVFRAAVGFAAPFFGLLFFAFEVFFMRRNLP